MSTSAVYGIGHNAQPLPPVGHRIWPDEAEAFIFRRRQPVTTSGKARTGQWVLRFERRTPPFIEPLMGWIGGDDTLTQVELTFASRDEAVRYAEREGLTYRIQGEPMMPVEPQKKTSEKRWEAAEQLYAAAALASIEARYGLGAIERRPDFDRALVNPAAVFTSPMEVVHDPSLSIEEKREVLRRWAWDEWLLEVAADEAMTEGEASRLDEVKTALRILEQAERAQVLVVTQSGGTNRSHS